MPSAASPHCGMTHRERIMAPFRGVRPDRPAWLADLSYWYGAMDSAGKLPGQYRGREGFKKLHEDLGVGCYYLYGASGYTTSSEGIEFHQEEKDGVRIRRWRTPVGEISDRWEYIPVSYCWAHSGYAVNSVADLRVVQDMFSRYRHAPAPDSYTAQAEFLGESGVAISAVPRSPLPALLADWCGVMNTIYLIADEPSAVQDTLAVIDRANEAAFECVAAGPAELLHFCDNLDSGNCGSYFEPFMEEYYARRLRQLHTAGKVAVVHLDGAVRGLLPKLARCGFDGVESITPGPVGDVEIEELRTVMANPRTIVWGGVPGAMFAPPWKAEDIRRHTRRLLDALWPAGRLIVGSADQIPPDGDIEFCRIIAETIEEYAG